MNIKIEKNLEEFLMSKGVLQEFIDEVERGPYFNIGDIFSDISGSFIWENTLGGWDYWSKLNNEFEKLSSD